MIMMGCIFIIHIIYIYYTSTMNPFVNHSELRDARDAHFSIFPRVEPGLVSIQKAMENMENGP